MDNSCRNCKNNEFGKCIIIEDIFNIEISVKEPKLVDKLLINIIKDIKDSETVDFIINNTNKISIKNNNKIIAKIKDNSFKCRLWE